MSESRELIFRRIMEDLEQERERIIDRVNDLKVANADPRYGDLTDELNAAYLAESCIDRAIHSTIERYHAAIEAEQLAAVADKAKVAIEKFAAIRGKLI